MNETLRCNVGNVFPLTGLHWEFGGFIPDEPSDELTGRKTTINPDSNHLFQMPIDSMMRMCTLELWDTIVTETYRYSEQNLHKLKKRKQLIAGYKWHPVSLEEILIIFGHESWNSPHLSPWMKFMTRGRFIQISSVIHFNNNDDADGMQSDSLHKVGPVLNQMKPNLGKYAQLGNEHSFDEATMACRSSYGRHLITFNAKFSL